MPKVMEPATDPGPSEAQNTSATRSFRPLVFGETLFDHFPDGTRALGGAPFNVAWHLQGFKAAPLLVTRVGEDPPGREVRSRMEEWGMDPRGVQVHPERPTGSVSVELAAGEARFRIESDQAWDEIEAGALPSPRLVEETDLLYHGTLALRGGVSQDTLSHLRETVAAPVLVDVNLRDPWWSGETVSRALEGAHWAKMNGHELAVLAGAPADTETAILEAARTIRHRYGVGHLVVTFGSRGALGLDHGGAVWEDAPAVADLVDTVGAGDAFSAVLALGTHLGWPTSLILRRAAGFAADICRTRGATGDDPELYARHLRRWRYDA